MPNNVQLASLGVLQYFYWPNVFGEENDAKRFLGYNVHAFDRSVIYLVIFYVRSY